MGSLSKMASTRGVILTIISFHAIYLYMTFILGLHVIDAIDGLIYPSIWLLGLMGIHVLAEIVYCASYFLWGEDPDEISCPLVLLLYYLMSHGIALTGNFFGAYYIYAGCGATQDAFEQIAFARVLLMFFELSIAGMFLCR